MSIKCFYHDDMDGICSAQIVKMRHPDAECFEIDYGNGFPEDTIKLADTVFMVDYGLQPFSRMIELSKNCNLVWIDHHKTAIDEYGRSGISLAGIRDVNLSACELTWKFFFPDRKTPVYVKLLGDFDCWRNEDKKVWNEEIDPFEMGMLSLSDEDVRPGGRIWNDFEMFGDVSVQAMIRNGQAIIKYLRKHNSDACRKYAFDVWIGGYNFITLNTVHRGSQQLESVYDEKKHDGMCVYRWNGNGYTFSLYSTKANVDCGKICMFFDGGGHKGAAGGRWSKREFAELFYK